MHETLAHVVAAEDQFARAAVPDREGEIAEKMPRAVGAPFHVGVEDQGTVGDIAE
jgi:hypothetical protein